MLALDAAALESKLKLNHLLVYIVAVN